MDLGRRSFWIAALGSLLLAGGVVERNHQSAYADPPPNVVLFLADDMGWTDWQYDATLNPTGSVVYETPNLLRLAQQSVNFTNAYASAPICSPTRAAILTGKSPARTRLTNFLPGSTNTSATLKEPSGSSAQGDWQRVLPGPGSMPNIVNTLQNNGYATGLFGKWHLGFNSPTTYGYGTNVGGNDYGGPDQGGGWFAGADGMWNGMPGLNSPGQYPSTKYLSDAITEQATAWIGSHASGPFFLSAWDYQAHISLAAPQNLIDKYTAKIQTLQNQNVDMKGHTNPTYAAMIEKMDGDVGAILDRLDDPNNDGNHADSVLNNTIFVFTSDNGGLYAAEGNPTRNLPLREGKGSIYEGGIRVPFMVSWGADQNIAEGTTTTARTSLYDLYPTLFNMTGVAMPSNNTIDGVNIRSAIEGAAFDRGLLYFHYPHRSNQSTGSPLITGGSFVSAVSNNDWKLIFFYEDRHYELYNLAADVGETTNLLTYNPAIAHDLSLALHDYLVGINAQYPVNKNTNVVQDPPTVLAAQIPGDYDGNTIVNAADYDFWKLNLGSTTHLAADGNRNGVVDIGDFVFWRKVVLGMGSGGGGGLGGLASVPEPSAAVLFGIAAVSFFAARRDRRRRR
jgi:arylsulfatase A-like enzyme